VRVERLLRRRDPILLDVSPGRAPDHLNLARIPREAELVEAIKRRFADVVAVHYPASGTHFHAYVSLRPSRPGSARQVLLALLGLDPYVKTAIAVDDDVDIERDGDVLWALATRFQPQNDLFVVDGLPGSALDPSASLEGSTGRLALDATRSPGFEAPVVRLDEAAVERARQLLDG
jgi:4-hydroxy-3-polyprenylbenzoate decarboxylase